MRSAVIVFLMVMVLGTAGLFAQTLPKVLAVKKANNDTIALRLDSSKTNVKPFDNQAIEKYKAEKEFKYGEDDDAQKLNWWQRFWKAFWEWIDRLFGDEEGTVKKPVLWPKVLKYASIVVIVSLIIFAVFKLVGIDWKIFSKKSKEVEVPYDESLENIHEISFEDELVIALQNQNYRLAVRLHYLQTLKNLNDKGTIDWQVNKTNSAYVAEVRKADGDERFAQLTYQFEYIWYGDFGIDKSAYSVIQQSFEQFNNSKQ